MNTTNPSTEAREAAQKICDMAKRAGFPIPGIVDVTGIIQSALDSALAASAARVKELEVLLQVCVDNLSEYVWRERDCEEWCEPQYLSEARAALSIKVGETK